MTWSRALQLFAVAGVASELWLRAQARAVQDEVASPVAEELSDMLGDQPVKPRQKKKSVEEIYQKKSPVEHVLLRPDTYVGSVEQQVQEMLVFDEAKDEIVKRQIRYVPALYKIFDEILVNAADNSMRDPEGMDLIDITINREEGFISVQNNGQGVPVVVHKEHGCYVPELIFGQLLTSDNYDDNEKKVTGGRNGYGAKLANIFSKKFLIETADNKEGKKFKQVYENNMFKKNKPSISNFKGPDYTKVTFWPDLARFNMTELDDDISALMMKRAFDIAGSTSKKVKVKLNGKRLAIGSFQDYVNKYFKAEGSPVVYERVNDRWEVAVGVSDGGFQQVSLVNSINTMKGGTHVTYVSDQIIDTILKKVQSKNKGGLEIKPANVKNHLRVFVNCLVENPAFDSQTKETLTTKQSKFGSTCMLSDGLKNKVMKSGIVDSILAWAKAKETIDLGKKMKGTQGSRSKVTGVAKLDDANDAGGRNSDSCTLILTEGDSAKALAVAGLSVVGRDKYGVFPLKGKMLNVRDANFMQVTNNEEIQNLMKIMGLDIRQQYNSTKRLRYGSIMIMTDQDYDGSHIKGLLINFIQFWWPSLARSEGFIKEFATPIIKVWKEGKEGAKDTERKNEKVFFTLNEYEEWKTNTPESNSYQVKYFKGLGTSTSKEAKEYFNDLKKHRLFFEWKDADDDTAIDLAFSKKRMDDRKEWINAYEEGTYVDHSQDSLRYYDFVHKELVQYAKYDLSRSVPSLVDGLKTSQRKVLFGAFKKKLKHDIKVAQLVGYISEHAAYHHGETSLEKTIIGLAQDFVGANNLNLLVPAGQFGTRLQGGKDHAASRYIYTRLAPLTRKLFPSDDDAVLNYLDDEGISIEPDFYCPILPMVLVNGAEGIGTGWSTSIPNFSPWDIIRNIQRMLRGEQMETMHPWYSGFLGSIDPDLKFPGKYTIMGIIEKKSNTTLEIKELPVGSWTENYKEFLDGLLPKDGKKPEDDPKHIITEHRDHHTENTVRFELKLLPEKMMEVEKQGFHKVFKLQSLMSTSNMVLFNAKGRIQKYNSSLEILQDFCEVRREVYSKRKAHLVAKLTSEKETLSNKARFILMVVNDELELRKKKKAQLLKELHKLGFKPKDEIDAILKGAGNMHVLEDTTEGGDGDDDTEKSSYDYLLGMNLWSLTSEMVNKLQKESEAKIEQLGVLTRTTVEQMWERDLEALLEELGDEPTAVIPQSLPSQGSSELDAPRKRRPRGDKDLPKSAQGEGPDASTKPRRRSKNLDSVDESSVMTGFVGDESSEFVAAPKKILQRKQQGTPPATASTANTLPSDEEPLEMSHGSQMADTDSKTDLPKSAPGKKLDAALKYKRQKPNFDSLDESGGITGFVGDESDGELDKADKAKKKKVPGKKEGTHTAKRTAKALTSEVPLMERLKQRMGDS